MKKLLIIFSLIFCVAGTRAQITLEHKYQGGAPDGTNMLRIVHFSSHGYMYEYFRMKSSTTGIIFLYNLNHSLYKTIDVKTSPPAYSLVYSVLYVSDSLFNTNPSDIEYMVYFEDSANYIPHVRIFDDVGNLLFTQDTVTPEWPNNNPPPSFYPYTEPITYTPNGYKMILNVGAAGSDTSASVYSLPGALPCGECASGYEITTASPNTQQGNGNLMNAYPNPTKNSTTIKYELPQGINQGDIVFYDLKGNQVKTFTVDRTFDSLLVTTADLAAGTYFYILRAGGNYVGSKKVVIIK